MKKTIKTLIAIYSLTVFSYASSQTIPGSTVIEICEKSKNTCESFLTGMVEGLITMQTISSVQLKNKGIVKLFCPQSSVTIGQGTRVVLKYLNEHPEEEHKSMGHIALSALAEAFPCK